MEIGKRPLDGGIPSNRFLWVRLPRSAQMEKVYVIYDPLIEKVLCVHRYPDMECEDCSKTYKERSGAYYLEEEECVIKEDTRNKNLEKLLENENRGGNM